MVRTFHSYIEFFTNSWTIDQPPTSTWASSNNSYTNSSSNSSTSSPTDSRTNIWADTLNSTTPISCPSADNSIQTMNAQKYLIHCDYDFMGDKSILMLLPNMTLHDCLYVCDSMNSIQQRNDIGSTFYDQDTKIQLPGNCWCVGNATQTVRAPGRVAAIPQKGWIPTLSFLKINDYSEILNSDTSLIS